MLFYAIQWLAISLLVCPWEKTKKYRKFAIILAGIIYVFFAVVRDFQTNTLLDAYSYYVIFNKASVPLLTYIEISNVEIGYSVLAWLIKNIFDSYVVLLFAIHTFVYCAVVYFINHIEWGKWRFLPTAALCLNLFVAYYLQRNIIAVCFGLLMMLMLVKKKYGRALVFFVLALLFHNSAVILFAPICFAFLLDRRNSFTRNRFVLLGLFAFVGSMLLTRVMVYIMSNSDKYSYYSNVGSIAKATDAVAILLLLIYLFNLQRTNEKFESAKVMAIGIACLLLIIPLQAEYSIMYRMILFFNPVLYIMPIYLKESLSGRETRFAMGAFSFVYYGYVIFSFFADDLQYIGIPYRFGF